jgi:hypothetical protein
LRPARGHIENDGVRMLVLNFLSGDTPIVENDHRYDPLSFSIELLDVA